MQGISHIFRSYDIRGIYGKDLDEGIMLRIGNAFGAFVQPWNVVVANDVRGSSLPLKKAFISGLMKTGKNISDAGLLPLGAGMFHAWQSGSEFAYITASHLPKEWNGVKFFHSSGEGFSESENMAVKDIFFSGSKESGAGALSLSDSRGILSGYKTYLSSKIRAKRKLKVVLDSGNGCASLVAKELFEECGFDVVSVFDKADGSFPNRNPEPNEDPLAELKNKIEKENADVGIAYDGDGDRMVILDNKTNVIPPENIAYFILGELLKKKKGPVIANVECTRLIDDIGKKFACEVIRVPVGHTFLVGAAHKYNAVFGVETSGHYIIPSLLPFDDSLAVSLYAAYVLSLKSETLSEIIKGTPKYNFKRVNFECGDEEKFNVIRSLKEKLAREYENVNTLDGVRIDFPDGWVLIRASNTSPLIRMSIEADSEKEAEKLGKKFSEMLREEIESCSN